MNFFENIFPYRSEVDKIRDQMSRGWDALIDDSHYVIQIEDKNVSEIPRSVTINIFYENQAATQSTKQSERVRRQPSHLQEYEVELPTSIDHNHPTSNSGTSTVHPLVNYVSYNNFSHNHKFFWQPPINTMSRSSTPKQLMSFSDKKQ